MTILTLERGVAVQKQVEIVLIAIAVATLGGVAARPAPIRLELALVVPEPGTPESDAAESGVRFGVEEAAHTARLFGADVALRVDRAARASVVIGGFARSACDTLAAQAARTPFVLLALGCSGRTADSTWTFHLEPAGGIAAAGSVLWHPALERYGAAQLNARFMERFGRPMSGAAWAGWMSVKIALEAALQARSTDPQRLREVLTGPIRFDGHKGAPLKFDASHRLVQPLYEVDGGSGEARR